MMRKLKILMIGDSGVGKSSMVARYCDDTFNPSFISTVGIDFKVRTIQLDGAPVSLQIWDTAGQERFRTITTSYFRGCMGAVVVYDLTDRMSFENLDTWLTSIAAHAPASAVRVLVANKLDAAETDRTIMYDEGAEKARLNNARFYETSAKGDKNVAIMFEQLARDILRVFREEEYDNCTISIEEESVPEKMMNRCCE